MTEFENLSEEERKTIVNKELDEVFNYLADLCKSQTNLFSNTHSYSLKKKCSKWQVSA